MAAQATPLTFLDECAPLCKQAGPYCSSGLESAPGVGPLEDEMQHVSRAPPVLPAATTSLVPPAMEQQVLSLPDVKRHKSC